jgi:hypothetical protein
MLHFLCHGRSYALARNCFLQLRPPSHVIPLEPGDKHAPDCNVDVTPGNDQQMDANLHPYEFSRQSPRERRWQIRKVCHRV